MGNIQTSLRKALVWALAFLAGACQFENTGSTRKSAEVAQALETLALAIKVL
jgi:hypothetical protein